MAASVVRLWNARCIFRVKRPWGVNHILERMAGLARRNAWSDSMALQRAERVLMFEVLSAFISREVQSTAYRPRFIAGLASCPIVILAEYFIYVLVVNTRSVNAFNSRFPTIR